MLNADTRIVLDTNVIVSGIIKPAGVLGEIMNRLVSNTFQLVMSEYILEEATRILVDKCALDAKFVHEHLLTLINEAIMVKPKIVSVPELSDVNDWPIIGTAAAGRANIIVTGDKVLLDLKQYHDIIVITPRKFLELS